MAEFVEGKISRFIPSVDRTSLRLDTHGSRQFILRETHPMYNSLYSFLMASTVNRYTVTLRLDDIASDDVVYITANFPQS